MNKQQENKWNILKDHLFVPAGWMLSAAYALLLLLSYFGIIETGNIVNIDYLTLLVVPVFTYCLAELIRSFSHKWIIRAHTVFSYVFCLSLSALAYIFIAGFEWSRYVKQNLFESSKLTDSILLFSLYVSSYLTLSLFTFLEETKEISVQKENIGDPDTKEWNSITEFIKYSVSLAVLFMGSMILRIKDLPDLSLWIDESTTVLVAKQIIDGLGQVLVGGDVYSRAYIYHHYLAWFMERFHGLGLYTVTRVANTPFFFIAFLGIFFLGSYIYSKRAGLIATALFSFSWISISIFREARFYEMFVALFIVLCFLLIYLDDLISKTSLYQKGRVLLKKADWKYGRKIFLTAVITAGVTWLCIDTQELVGFILYPFILVGILIFIFNRDAKGLIISALSFFTLLGKLAYDYNYKLQWMNLIKYPEPAWKMLEPDYPFSYFWNYLMINQYSYLIGIGVLVLPLLFIRYNRRALYVLAIAIGWFSIVSYQGYNEQIIRYYYPALPFLVLTIAYVFENYYHALKKFIPRSLFAFLLVLLVGMTFYGGLIESGSAAERNSRNVPKNANDDTLIDFMLSTGTFGISTMMTDDVFSMPYYLTFETAPDYVVLNTDFYKLGDGNIEAYTGAPEIDYREISTVKKPAYFVFSNNKTRVGLQYLAQLENIGGHMVYKDGSRFIYLFPAATSTKQTIPKTFVPRGIDQ